MQIKNNIIDTFQAWLPQAEAESGFSIKILKMDGGGEFILYKLQMFYEKRGILIKYVFLYVYKENR